MAPPSFDSLFKVREKDPVTSRTAWLEFPDPTKKSVWVQSQGHYFFSMEMAPDTGAPSAPLAIPSGVLPVQRLCVCKIPGNANKDTNVFSCRGRQLGPRTKSQCRFGGVLLCMPLAACQARAVWLDPQRDWEQVSHRTHDGRQDASRWERCRRARVRHVHAPVGALTCAFESDGSLR